MEIPVDQADLDIDHREPGDHTVDPEADTWLAEKLVACVPSLADLPLRRRWACLRTFSRDNRFVIGWGAPYSGLRATAISFSLSPLNSSRS